MTLVIHGVAIFSLFKDVDVVLFELESIGLREVTLSTSYLRAIDLAEAEFKGLLGKYTTRRCFAYVINRRRVLLCLYLDDNNKVRKALFIGLSSGVIRLLVRRVERLGWTRAFMFEFREVSRRAHTKYR